MKKYTLIFLVFFLVNCLFAQTYSNVVYASKSSANKLDIFLPTTGKSPYPCIIMIHGGAFQGGDKSMEASNAKIAITKGYAVASINYRLTGEAIFPAQIYDVKAAIRFLRANASTYSFDPTRFVSWGESAGGGLAALAGTSGDVASLEDLTMGNSTFSSRVQAAVDLYGPINFLTMNAQWDTLGVTNGQDHNKATSPESILVGGPIQTKQDICNQYNPETYITKDDPPFFIEHGSDDVLIPYLQGKNIANKLSPIIGSNKVSFTLLNGAGHGSNQFTTTGNLDLIWAFLDKSLASITDIEGNTSESVPADIKLYQNYPNPFNPSTIIRYQLPEFSHISLKVYDILGREVITLVNEYKQRGIYHVVFDSKNIISSSFPSGIYLCRLKSGTYSQTMKLMVVK